MIRKENNAMVTLSVDIWFVNLGLKLEEWVKTFKIGTLEIYFYGCIIAFSVLLALTVASIVARKTGQNPDYYAELMLWSVIVGIIGARLYYVAFDWDNYKDNLKEIFNLRAGGLAIYGGLIAGALAAFIYCRIKKLDFAQALDTAFVGVVLAQSTGRWSNFVNMECFGGYTENLLAMRLNKAKVNSYMISPELLEKAVTVDGVTYIQVHPTFLYESLWNLCLFIILLIMTKKKRFHGQVFLLYLMGYGVGRFWIEGLRTDQLRIGHTDIAISQVVSVVLFVLALILYIVGMNKAKKIEAILAQAETEATNKLKGHVAEIIEADRLATEAEVEGQVHAQEAMEQAAEDAEQARSEMEEAAGEMHAAEAELKAAEEAAAAETAKAADDASEALQDAADDALAKVQDAADDAVAKVKEAAEAAVAKVQEAAAAAEDKIDG